MSVLVVDYGALSNLNSTATRLASKFQKRIEDNEGIIKNINSIPRSGVNLGNANYFIKKRNEQYLTKINKLNAFKSRISDFSKEVEDTDKRVASRITSETKAFKKANKINISVFVVVGNFLGSWTKTPLVRGIENWIDNHARDAKYWVKDWYRNDGHKFLVNVVIGAIIAVVIVAVVITTVLTGGAVLGLLGATLWAQIFTGFVLVSAACSWGYDIAALVNYNKTGNMASSRQLDKKGGSEVFGTVFGGIGYGAGYIRGGKEMANEFKQRGENAGKLIFSGLSIAACVYGFSQIGFGVYKFRQSFTRIKSMGMMNGMNNWNVLKKTILMKGIVNDFKLGIGAESINMEINISLKIFGKNKTYSKAIFNMAGNGAKGLAKEALKNGLIKSIQDGGKDVLGFGDLIKDMLKPQRLPTRMPHITLTQ